MQTLEELLVQTLTIGFFLLSLSLATGLMFMHDMLGQHLSHKVVLSMLAWLIFAVVLWGRWSRGWRGRTLIHWTLGGFASLLLAYFGSKLVLELICSRLNRILKNHLYIFSPLYAVEQEVDLYVNGDSSIPAQAGIQ